MSNSQNDEVYDNMREQLAELSCRPITNKALATVREAITNALKWYSVAPGIQINAIEETIEWGFPESQLKKALESINK